MFFICFLFVVFIANIIVKGQTYSSPSFFSPLFVNKDTCYVEKFTGKDSSISIETKFDPKDFLLWFMSGKQLVALPIINEKTTNFPIVLKNFYFTGNILVAEIGFVDYEYNPINQPSLFISVRFSNKDKKSFGKAQKKMLKLTMDG